MERETRDMLQYLAAYLEGFEAPANYYTVRQTLTTLFTEEEFNLRKAEVQSLLEMHFKKFSNVRRGSLDTVKSYRKQRFDETPIAIKTGNLKKKGDKSGFWTSRSMALYANELEFSHQAKSISGKISIDPDVLKTAVVQGKDIILTLESSAVHVESPRQLKMSSPRSQSTCTKTFRADTEREAVEWQRAILKARHQIIQKRKSRRLKSGARMSPPRPPITEQDELTKSKIRKQTWELGVACSDGNWENVKKAIRKGAEINSLKFGHAALHYACISGSLRLVKGLVSAKADIELVDKTWQIPAELAARRGHTEIVTFLYHKLQQHHQKSFLNSFYTVLSIKKKLPEKCVFYIRKFINSSSLHPEVFVELPLNNRTAQAAIIMSKNAVMKGKLPITGVKDASNYLDEFSQKHRKSAPIAEAVDEAEWAAAMTKTTHKFALMGSEP